MMLERLIPAALANHLWQSSLFAVAAALLTFTLRNNRAQTRYFLWLIASLKFLVPFSLLFALGARLQWPVRVAGVHPAVSVLAQQIGQPFAVSSAVFESTVSKAKSLVPAILFAVWLCGFLIVLVFWSRSWLRVWRAVRSSAPLPLSAPIKILSSSAQIEPGVFGIFRPVLLLPAGITAHLTTAHLAAILAHELCHVRRRDNLAAALHMLVEAVFWFHPLVWWIGARLVEERERACDEEVLGLGNEANVYAESILKTCQFYVESPLACVSGVTGADLKQRIVRIMTQRIAARLDLRKKILLAAAALTAITLPLAIGLAQNTLPDSFEVASIKPSKPGTRGMMVHVQPGGRLVANNITVEILLEEAYHLTKSQISGAPPWIDSAHFDITAKPEDSTGAAIDKLPPKQRLDKMEEMVRSLLGDRFKLVLGHETKELPVYFLVVAKSGPKFRESTYKPLQNLPDAPPRPGKGGPPPQGIYMNGRGKLTVANGDMAKFANVLSPMAGRIVLDMTNLPGKYDFTLQTTPDETLNPMPPGAGPGPTPEAAPPSEQSGPSLFTAIQEQLGLKLEPQKAPVEILVIKHMEKPSEN